MPNNKTISVIIATKDRKEDLLKFIESLNQQTLFPDEFLIVDASEHAFEAEIRKNISSNYTFKYIKASPGLTKQRNIGIKESNGDVLCFFDDDIILEPDYLNVLKESFESHPEIGGFSGKTTNVKPLKNWRFFLMQIFNYFFQLPYFEENGQIRKSFFNNNYNLGEEENYIEFTSGCNMAFTKKSLQEVGEFDEKLSTYCYMEDVDISYRITRKYKILYNPKARCIHNHSKTNRLKHFEQGKMLIINQYYLHKKNLPHRRIYRLAFWISFFGLILSNLFNLNFRKVRGFLSGIKNIYFEKKLTQ